MSSLMFDCLKVLISAIFEKRVTNGRMDGWTDGPTGEASYGISQLIISRIHYVRLSVRPSF